MTGLSNQLSSILPAPSSGQSSAEFSSGGVPIPGHKPAQNSNLLDILSKGSNLASVAVDMFGGYQEQKSILAQTNQQSRALDMAAEEDLLAAKQEEVRGKEEANDILDNLIQTIASQRLATAANGVDVGFGTPVNVTQSTQKLANLQLGVTRRDALVRSIARRRQGYANQEAAINTRNAGQKSVLASKMSSAARAGGTVLEQIMREQDRG